VVTGGARDFGYEIATALAGAGAHVIITSRTLQAAQDSAVQLRSAYPKSEILPLQLDVRHFEAVEDIAQRAIQWKGRVDILINNAGVSPGEGGGLFDREVEHIEETVTLNLLGTIWCCKAFGRTMQEQRYGKVINISSIAALVGRDSRMYSRHGMRRQPLDYAAAKGGVISFSRDLAALLGPSGIRVNCVSPGGFGPRPSFPQEIIKFWDSYSDHTPLGYGGKPGDLQGLILFLSSPASDYVHGENIVIDGGFSSWQ